MFHIHKWGRWQKKTYLVRSVRQPEWSDKLFQERQCVKCGLFRSEAL